jgi:acyl carrier protein
MNEKSLQVGSEKIMEEQIQKVLSSVFTAHQGPFESAYGPAEIIGWDSMNHLSLIMALQDEFSVEFGLEDMMAITTVGDIQTVLAGKIKS